MTANAVVAAALAAALGACASHDAVAAAAPFGETLAPVCQGAATPALVDGRCPAALARQVFTHAVSGCVASSLTDLTTDAFDSRVAPWTPGGGGGDVAVLGGLSSGGLLRVGGSLAVSGGGLEAGSALDVAGDLDVGGALGRPSSVATVGGSARIGGDVSVASLSVGGTLTTPPGAILVDAIVAGSTVTGAVAVPAPPACDAGQAISVASIVAEHEAANDDASIGLSPAALSAVSGTVAPLALPCGRFFLDVIPGSGDVTLRATGRATLFVRDGISLGGSLTVELAPGAELDLFVAGPVNLPGTLRLGDPTRPSALRVWVAASGAINVPAGALVAANLFAPAADLASSGPVEVYGALVVAHVNPPLSVHYDRAVAVAGAGTACGR